MFKTLPLITINKLELGSNGDPDGGLIIYELSTYGDGIIPALYHAQITLRNSNGDEIDTIPLVDAPIDIVREAEREVALAFLSATSPLNKTPKG